MHMRQVTLAMAGAALVMALSQPANAIEEAGQAYIAPMGTYFHGDNDRDTKDGFKGATLGVGFALEDHWNVELAAQRISLDSDTSGGPSGHQTGIMVNALNLYNRGGRFEPYLLGGVGMESTSAANGPNKSNFQAQGGIGVMTSLIQNRLGLRTEVVYRFDDASKSLGDIIFNLGLQVPIGGKKAAVAAPASAAVVDTDTDGDGVVDRLDKCPSTPRGAKVDASGCPLDSDGDGVYDGIDQCPNTPKGATVDAVGCPKDSDGDGVYDGIDQCPDTPKGVKVDDRGCGNIIELPGVNFENDSAKLKPGSEAILDKAVATLKANPTISVEVQGHTDSNGSAKHNEGLSQHRAESVRAYLVKGGIAASRVTAKGYGQAQPIADNKTADGRAKNRRVVLKVTKQ